MTTPLAGIVSRLAAQKGIELMFDSLPQVLQWRDLGFVALGSGEPQYERFFAELARSFPGRVVFRQGYDDELSHWIEAACDMFLMPSLYEPCGLNQMYSLRYGTVPIVRRTGGLADSVEQYDPATGAGHRHRLRRLRLRGAGVGAQHGARSPRRACAVAAAWCATGWRRTSRGKARERNTCRSTVDCRGNPMGNRAAAPQAVSRSSKKNERCETRRILAASGCAAFTR